MPQRWEGVGVGQAQGLGWAAVQGSGLGWAEVAIRASLHEDQARSSESISGPE